MNTDLEKLKQIRKSSVFTLSPNYSVNVCFRNLFKNNGGLISYNEDVEQLNSEETMTPTQIIAKMTPEFQRNNTKWTQKMQRQFVENILLGCKTELHLYGVKGRGSELGQCMILDGLQRLTAISSFQSGEFSIFDGMLWENLSTGGIFPRLNLLVNIFTFSSDVEACRHYIQINKGTTHSESDLKTAYDFMDKWAA
ncbi:hypothetical protein OKZ62_001847 [Vibrio navarrensis]|nr:hypothetical protein [Vibrio navarrensis]